MNTTKSATATFELYPLTGSMRDANHTPEAVAARVADASSRYAIGMTVRRPDGCNVTIERIEAPTCGGYLYASGREAERGGLGWQTGPLHKCTPVAWVIAPRRDSRTGEVML
jgi:hypothetical protein